MNPKLYYELLKDLQDSDFEAAVVCIAKTTTELYPDSNLIAIIREKAKENRGFKFKKIIGKTENEMQLIKDMEETYQKRVKRIGFESKSDKTIDILKSAVPKAGK